MIVLLLIEWKKREWVTAPDVPQMAKRKAVRPC
jgi:hypothetical protein